MKLLIVYSPINEACVTDNVGCYRCIFPDSLFSYICFLLLNSIHVADNFNNPLLIDRFSAPSHRKKKKNNGISANLECTTDSPETGLNTGTTEDNSYCDIASLHTTKTDDVISQCLQHNCRAPGLVENNQYSARMPDCEIVDSISVEVGMDVSPVAVDKINHVVHILDKRLINRKVNGNINNDHIRDENLKEYCSYSSDLSRVKVDVQKHQMDYIGELDGLLLADNDDVITKQFSHKINCKSFWETNESDTILSSLNLGSKIFNSDNIAENAQTSLSANEINLHDTSSKAGQSFEDIIAAVEEVKGKEKIGETVNKSQNSAYHPPSCVTVPANENLNTCSSIRYEMSLHKCTSPEKDEELNTCNDNKNMNAPFDKLVNCEKSHSSYETNVNNILPRLGIGITSNPLSAQKVLQHIPPGNLSTKLSHLSSDDSNSTMYVEDNTPSNYYSDDVDGSDTVEPTYETTFAQSTLIHDEPLEFANINITKDCKNETNSFLKIKKSDYAPKLPMTPCNIPLPVISVSPSCSSQLNAASSQLNFVMNLSPPILASVKQSSSPTQRMSSNTSVQTSMSELGVISSSASIPSSNQSYSLASSSLSSISSLSPNFSSTSSSSMSSSASLSPHPTSLTPTTSLSPCHPSPCRRKKGHTNTRERTVRRIESNERERMRMHSLNDAFQVSGW